MCLVARLLRHFVPRNDITKTSLRGEAEAISRMTHTSLRGEAEAISRMTHTSLRGEAEAISRFLDIYPPHKLHMKTILGIDPGFARMGFGVITAAGSTITHIAHGCIETSKEKSFSERLNKIGEEFLKLLETYHPDVVSIEELFFTKNVKTGIAVAHSRGVILFLAATRNVLIYEITPTQVKIGLTGYGGADKKQMERMVMMQLGLKEIPKPDDAADALAIAICGSSYFSIPRN